MKKLLIIVVIILAAVIVFFGAKSAMDDADGLGGDPWTLVAIEADGKKIPMKKSDIMKLRFGKDKVTWFLPTRDGSIEEVDGPFRLDPNKQPRQIDIAVPPEGPEEQGQMAKGIYEVKDEFLFICTGAERPTEFKTGPRSERVVWVFKR